MRIQWHCSKIVRFKDDFYWSCQAEYCSELFYLSTATHLSTIKFAHFDFDPWPLSLEYILSPSVINLDLDCCEVNDCYDGIATNLNISNITITGHLGLNFPTIVDSISLVPSHSIFSKVTNVSADNTLDSYELLRLGFPSLSRLEFFPSQHMDNLVQNFHFVLPLIFRMAALKLLVIPEELFERLEPWAKFQLEEQGIAVRCVEA